MSNTHDRTAAPTPVQAGATLPDGTLVVTKLSKPYCSKRRTAPRAERAWIVHPEPRVEPEKTSRTGPTSSPRISPTITRVGLSRRVALRMRSLTVCSPSPSADGGRE